MSFVELVLFASFIHGMDFLNPFWRKLDFWTVPGTFTFFSTLVGILVWCCWPQCATFAPLRKAWQILGGKWALLASNWQLIYQLWSRSHSPTQWYTSATCFQGKQGIFSFCSRSHGKFCTMFYTNIVRGDQQGNRRRLVKYLNIQ